MSEGDASGERVPPNPFAPPECDSVARTGSENASRIAPDVEQAMRPVLRQLELQCSALGFLLGIGSLLPLALAAFDFYAFAQGRLPYLPTIGILGAAIGSCLFLVGAAIHLRQIWAVWIAMAIALLYLVLQVSTFNLCGIAFGLIGSGLPLTLGMNIRSLASKLRSAGIPPTAEVTKNGIEW